MMFNIEEAKMPLAQQVLDRLARVGVEFSPDDTTEALRQASELADLFSYVTPNISTIPLDALAGFPVAHTEKNS